MGVRGMRLFTNSGEPGNEAVYKLWEWEPGNVRLFTSLGKGAWE